jgi:hypothetical protein
MKVTSSFSDVRSSIKIGIVPALIRVYVCSGGPRMFRRQFREDDLPAAILVNAQRAPI